MQPLQIKSSFSSLLLQSSSVSACAILPNGTVVQASTLLLQYTGFTSLQGLHLSKFIITADWAVITEHIYNCEQGGVQQGIFVCQTAQGKSKTQVEFIFDDSSGHIICLFKPMASIAIADFNTRIGAVAKQMAFPVVLTNAALEIEWCNEAFEKFYEITLEEILYQHIFKVWGSGITVQKRERLKQAVQHKKQVDISFDFTTHKNLTHNLLISLVPYADTAKGIEGFYIRQVDQTKHKQNQQILEESLERLNLILGTAKMGVWDIQLKTDTITFDATTKKLFGHTGDSFTTTIAEWQRLILPEDYEQIQRQIQEAVTTTGEFHAIFRVRINNEIHYLEGHATIVKNSAGLAKTILGICWDITDTVLSKEKIELQNQLLQSVQEAVQVFDKNGNLVYQNKFAEDLYGYNLQQANVPFLMLHESKYTIDEVADIQNCLQTLQPWSGEREVITSQGNLFPAFIGCSPLTDEVQGYKGFVAVSFDVSMQKNAQESLVKSLHRLSNTVENLPVGAVLIHNGKFEVNNYVEQITGFSRNEIQTVEQWFVAAYRENASSVKALYIGDREKGFPASRIVPLTRKNGDTRWVQFSGFLDADVEIWVLQDVTEQKVAELQITSQNERLKQIAHLQSHEVRRPLSNIMGLLHLFDENLLDLSEPQNRQLLLKSGIELDEVITKIVYKTRNL
ncbi:MAG: PAS domain S-box protein [Bacteroidetes bacterium]|nr:MAG: PAS domain S-box protein [Bacteroidota bacterium]